MKVKRKLLIILSLIFVICYSTMAYAITGGFQNNAGGSSSSTASGNGLAGDAQKTLYSNTSGYRITLIDPNTGEPKSKSIDILFSEPPSDTISFTTSRVESTFSNGDSDSAKSNISTYDMYVNSSIQSMLKSAGYSQIDSNPVPTWFTRNGKEFTGEGETFREWFCPESALDALSGWRTALENYTTAQDNLNSYHTDYGITDGAGESLGGFARPDNVLRDNVRGSIVDVNKHVEKLTTDAVKAVKDCNDLNSAIELYKDTLTVFNNCYYENKIDFTTFVTTLKTTISIAYGEKGSKALEECRDLESTLQLSYNTNNKNKFLDFISEHFTLLSYADEKETESSGQTSSKADLSAFYAANTNTFDTSKYGWALAIFSLENNGVGIFALNGESGQTMAELFANGEAYACVEPVLFFKPQTTKNYPYTFLGTAKNYADFSMAVLASWDPVALSGGNIFRGTNIVFFRGLILAKNESESANTVGKERTPFLANDPYKGGNEIGTELQTYGIYQEPRYRAETAKALIDSNFGIGMQLYCVGRGSGSSSINTYDIDNNPKWDDNSESSDDKPDESDDYKEENKNKTFQIVKFYRVNLRNGNYFEWSYYAQSNTPHTIEITDEAKIGWKLKEWYTSESTWMPENGGSPEDYPWEIYVKAKNKLGTYAGTDEGLLTVLPEDTDNTLYLLYEAEFVDEEDDNITVIRVYDNEDGDTDKVEKDTVSGNPYTVPDGGTYTYTETKTTPNSPKSVSTWYDSEGSTQGKPELLYYPDDTKTIYVHYVKAPENPATQKIVLYENELSYNYDLRDLLQNRRLISIYDDVQATPFVYPSCSGHYHRVDEDDSHYDYCYTKNQGLTDRNWTVAVEDTFDQNTLSFIKDWTYTSSMSIRGMAIHAGGNGSNYKVTPQATFLLIRDKVSDVVTLYPKKNTSLLSELSSLNLTENYTSADTRKNHLRETDRTKQFYSHLFTQLAYSSARDTELSWWTTLTGSRGSHKESGTYYTSTAAGHSPDDANNAYSQNNNVETRYFLGKAGTGSEKPSFGISDWQKKYKNHNYNASYSESTLSFYPYLEYQYYYKDSSTAQSVMVTSSNLSTIKVYNAVQIGVYKKNDINANLTSTQWSTHARSLSFLQNKGISDKKSVLPGGAIQDIDMGNQGDTQIGVTLWQTCLKDELVETVQQDGFKVSESEAKTAATNLQDEIKKTIGGYGLVQYGAEGVFTDKDGILSDGEELHENTDVSFILGNSGRTSSDSKYYLRHDSTGSNRANFDCLDTRIEHQYLYTVKSDTNGNVIVTVSVDGGAESELSRISKTEDVSKLLQNKEIALLDANTKLVTNYVQAIERNKGTARNGNKWFNEAHDGISVLRTEMSFDVGFGSGNTHRTNVLDPLLTAKTESKSDLYNFSDESKVRSSVYVTSDTSTTATKSETQGYMGTLKAVSGMTDLEVSLKDIQSMVYTKNFYIPNANVSDLN